MSENYPEQVFVELNETGRIEAFSDGVFAIAITLLILEIRVPHELPEGVSLWNYMLGEWQLFAAFLAGFIMIGIMWINHHRIFQIIQRGDSWLMIWNLLLLLGVTFINYPTALLGDFLGTPDATAAMLVFTGTTVCIAIFYNLLWRHAVRANLLDTRADLRVVSAVTRGYLFGPVWYGIAFVFAFFNVYVSLAIAVGLAIFFALPQRNILTDGKRS